MGHLIRKTELEYCMTWEARGLSYNPTIAIQVPKRVRNKDPTIDWVQKTNKTEIWISMNGKVKLNKQEWDDFKKRVDFAFSVVTKQ